MYYSLGTDDESALADGWSTFVPKAADAGKYYVWYKVVGDDSFNGTEPACVEVTIERSAQQKIYEAKAVKTTLIDVWSDENGTLSAKWTSDAEADGYEVLIWNSRRMGGRTTVSKFDTGTDTEITVEDLVPGSRCYVKARAYRIIDGRKVCGKYSSSGSATVKGFNWGFGFVSVPGHGHGFAPRSIGCGHGYSYGCGLDPYVTSRDSFGLNCGRPHLAPNYYRFAMNPYFFYRF